jgi:hypothetical protein
MVSQKIMWKEITNKTVYGGLENVKMEMVLKKICIMEDDIHSSRSAMKHSQGMQWWGDKLNKNDLLKLCT